MMAKQLRIAACMVAAAWANTAHAQAIEISREMSKGSTLPFAAPPPKPAAPIAPPKPAFVLATGQPIDEGLQLWAKTQDWDLLWYPSVTWRTLRGADFSNASDVVAAVSEVINILREEGKPVQLRVSEGNRVMEVLSTEVSQ
jgi:hypothetical protein